MKRIALSLFALLVLSIYLLPSGFGLLQPELTFYPSRVTANSSFVIVADPNPVPGDVIRVIWETVGTTPSKFGLFPKIGDQWICYFSNSDPLSTCGPSPYTMTNAELLWDWEINITSINQDGETGRRDGILVEVGGIDLIPSNINELSDRSVDVVVCPGWVSGGGVTHGVDRVRYESYHSNMTSIGNGDLEFDAELTNCYIGNIALGSYGDFFITFEADQNPPGDDFGGVAVKVSLEPGAGPGLQPGSAIEAENVTKSIKFSYIGQDYTGTGFVLTNIGETNLTGLTVDVSDPDADFSNCLSITIDDTLGGILESGESTTFSYTVDNIPAEGLYVNTWFDVLANVTDEEGNVTEENVTVGEIFMRLGLSVQGGAVADPCEGKNDGFVCSIEGQNGLCVMETCVVGAECIDNNDCSGGKVCTALRCTEVGGCATGSDCYLGAGYADCPSMTVYTGHDCTFGEDQAGVCCETVDCMTDDDCTDLTPHCSSDQKCVECTGDEHCTAPTSICYVNNCVQCIIDADCSGDEECINNQCAEPVIQTICSSEDARCVYAGSDCPEGYVESGETCDKSEPGANDGKCCVEAGDIMPMVFIIIIIAIVGGGAWYYFKKYKKGKGGKGKGKHSKEEEDLEKELEEEF